MKQQRTAIAVSLAVSAIVVALLLVGLSGSAPAALAHPVTVNGSLNDWITSFPTPPTNNGHVMRNASYEGEFIWTDASGDQRTDGDDPDSNYDLTGFRVTADSTNMYFLLRFADLTDASRPYVGIALDTNRDGTGNDWFGDWADTQTSAKAKWERQIVVNLNKTGYYDVGWTWHDAGSSNISTTTDLIEIAMPLSDLGVSLTGGAVVRFTVLVGQNDGGGIKEVWGSDALDCITTQSGNTWNEVSDGVIDYYFDVYFEPDGDPTSPLQVSEVYYDATGDDPSNEFVEVYNPAQYLAYLDGMLLGDETDLGETEGIYQFPGTALTGTTYVVQSGAYVVVAVDAMTYDSDKDFPDHYWANWETAGGTDNPAIPNLTRVAGSYDIALGNSGDNMVLRDGSVTGTQALSNTVVDGMNYENGGGDIAPADPLVADGGTNPSANTGYAVQRDPTRTNPDTNNSTTDFEPDAVPTPGFAKGLIDHAIYKKGPSPATVSPGQTFNYYLYWQVAGQPAPSAVITDILPDHTTFITYTSSRAITLTSSTGPTIAWNLGTIPASTIGKITVTVRLDASAPLGAVLTQTATIDSQSTITEGITTNDVAVYTCTVQGADLTVDKTGPAVIMPGERLTYTISISNIGITGTADLTVTDWLPNYVTYVSDTSGVTPTNPAAGVYVWNLGGVAASGAISFDLVCDVAITTPFGAALTNTVSVSTSGAENSTANNSDQCLVTVGGPNLVVGKSAPATASPGQMISYTVSVANAGLVAAHNVWVTDTLPAQATYYTDTLGGYDGHSGQDYGWSLGTLNPGASVTFTVVVNVSAGACAGDVLTNTVQATATEGDQDPSDNTSQATTTIAGANLYVSKSASATILFGGEQTTYTITYGNNGTVAASAFLTDTLPTGFTYASDTSGFPPGVNGNVISWNLGTVNAGAQTSFSLVVTVTASTPITQGTVVTNTVTIGPAGSGNNPNDDTATATGTVYQLVPIATARAGANGQTFAIEGRVIYVPGTYQATGWGLQDASGGIAAYYSPAPTVALGDQVRLVATRGAYQNEEQMSTPVYYFANRGSGPEVSPSAHATGDIPAGATEGWLVQVEGYVSGLGACTGNYSFYVNDGSGAAYIYVDQDTGVNVCSMGIANGDYVRVVGFSTQFQTTYEVKPRRPADVTELYPVTFIYHDAEDVVHVGEALNVAGSFNGWNTNATPLAANADHSVFSVTVTMPLTGTYEYKYVVKSSGDQWDWLNTANRSVYVTGPTTVNDYRSVAVGYAHLMTPPTVTISLGQPTGLITGEVYIQNVTNPAGEGRGVSAELGYGTTADPESWTWVPLSFTGLQNGNNDIYSASFTPAATGVYSYAVRFDGNRGAGNPNADWTYGDLDGVYPGEPFELSQCGVLTVQAADLAGSSKLVTPTADVKPGDLLTYTIRLVNASGATIAPASVTLTDTLPAEVQVVTATLPAGLTYHAATHTLTWSGSLAAGETEDLVFQVHVLSAAALPPGVHVFHNTVEINDGFGTVLTRQSADVTVTAYRLYLPLIARNSP